MAKFIYKMQNILDIKLKLEEQEKTNYAIAIAELEKEKKKKELLENKKSSYESKLTGQVNATLHIVDIRATQEAIEVLKYRIHEQMVHVRNAEVVAERARQALRAAMIERKTYEKLKEKAFEDFKKEVNEQEKKEVDELVSYKFGSSSAS